MRQTRPCFGPCECSTNHIPVLVLSVKPGHKHTTLLADNFSRPTRFWLMPVFRPSLAQPETWLGESVTRQEAMLAEPKALPHAGMAVNNYTGRHEMGFGLRVLGPRPYLVKGPRPDSLSHNSNTNYVGNQIRMLHCFTRMKLCLISFLLL